MSLRNFDARCVTLAIVAFTLLIVFKLELIDFETTIISFFILFIFGFNAMIILLIQIKDGIK